MTEHHASFFFLFFRVSGGFSGTRPEGMGSLVLGVKRRLPGEKAVGSALLCVCVCVVF